MEDDKDRHLQLMQFLTEFRKSTEDNIKTTNDKIEMTNLKIDVKLKEINDEMKELSTKIDENKKQANEAEDKMDVRLKMLEDEMIKVGRNKERREGWRGKVVNRVPEKEKVTELQPPVTVADRPVAEKEPRGRAGQGEKTLENFTKERNTLKKFNRSVVEKSVLINDTIDEREAEPGKQSTEKGLIFHSSWANEVEDEWKSYEEQRPKECCDPTRRKENRNEGESVNWEVLEKRKERKVRKPVALKNWFGTKTEDLSESSDSSQEEGDKFKWKEVDREKANLRKRKEKLQKMKDKKREICTRMQYMTGIGPIEEDSIKFYAAKGMDDEEARKAAVREYLRYFLSYNKEEIDDLEIIETKRANKDKIVYCAFNKKEDVKLIHSRRAASRNEDLLTRDYIAPQMWSRYIGLANEASEKRMKDKDLKTQIRWGEKDVEIWMKKKGSEENLVKIDLVEFMDGKQLPEIDLNIKWKASRNRRDSKELVFGERKEELPSLRNRKDFRRDTGNKNGLVRQHSEDSSQLEARKKRKEVPESVEMEDYNEESDKPAGSGMSSSEDEGL